MDNVNDRTFAPHIVEGEVPSLCFKPKHYLSWFRGYRFQVSASSDGTWDLGSSQTSLRHDLILTHGLPEEIRPLIAYSHVCEAAARFEDFWRVLENEPKLFNDFMNLTDKEFDIRCKNFDINSIFSLAKSIPVNEYTGMISNPGNYVASRPLISLAAGGKTYFSLGSLTLKRDSILVYGLAEDKAFQISFPDYNSICENINEDEREYYDVLWSRLPWVLFGFVGIVFDSSGCRNRSKRQIENFIEKTNEISEFRDFHIFIEEFCDSLDINKVGISISANPYE